MLQDTEAALCARRFLVSKVNVQTNVAEASKLGSSTYKLQRARTHCAAAALLHERLQALEVIHSVVGDVQGRGGELICFSWFTRYDETPLKFRVSDGASLDKFSARVGGATRQLDLGMNPVFQDTVPHKVCQTESGVSMLVRVADEFWQATLHLTCWLQAMDSTRAACYFRALQQTRLSCDEVAKEFRCRQRIASTDGDGAVAKAERAFGRLDKDLLELHASCQVHAAASCRKKAMFIMDNDVSGRLVDGVEQQHGHLSG